MPNTKIFHPIPWSKTGILKSILGDTLFVINHPITLDRINQARQEYFLHQLPKCTLSDWNNETIMEKLYEEGLLNITSPIKAFWDCFRNSYNANSKGIDGKTRVLSIIAERFTYKEIIDELGVI